MLVVRHGARWRDPFPEDERAGEHGVGMEKRDYLPAMFPPEEIACLKRVRGAFDPKGISNPGKMFPVAGAPALVQSGLHPLEKAGVISRE